MRGKAVHPPPGFEDMALAFAVGNFSAAFIQALGQ
jgi:hypothetical protein